MIEELLVAAAPLAVSAITFIAYRHPRIYNEVLFDKLYWGAFIVFLILSTWGLSQRFTLAAVEDFIPSTQLENARAAADQFIVPLPILLLFYWGVLIFLLFLSWLAKQFLKEHDRKSMQ